MLLIHYLMDYSMENTREGSHLNLISKDSTPVYGQVPGGIPGGMGGGASESFKQYSLALVQVGASVFSSGKGIGKALRADLFNRG